jgi:hypothetical protein
LTRLIAPISTHDRQSTSRCHRPLRGSALCVATRATLALDAIGGGKLASQMLNRMEVAVTNIIRRGAPLRHPCLGGYRQSSRT